jgi:hypothetical protein
MGLAQRFVIWTWNEFHLSISLVGCFGKWTIDSNNWYTYLFALLKLCTPSLSKVANHTYYFDANLNTEFINYFDIPPSNNPISPKIPHTHSDYFNLILWGQNEPAPTKLTMQDGWIVDGKQVFIVFRVL